MSQIVKVNNKNHQKGDWYQVNLLAKEKGLWNYFLLRKLILGNNTVRAKIRTGYWSTSWKEMWENEFLAFIKASGRVLPGKGSGMVTWLWNAWVLQAEAANCIRHVSALTCWRNAPWAMHSQSLSEDKRRDKWDSRQTNCQSLQKKDYTTWSWDKTETC